eukprot:2970082-Rhodomonas_salina.2
MQEGLWLLQVISQLKPGRGEGIRMVLNVAVDQVADPTVLKRIRVLVQSEGLGSERRVLLHLEGVIVDHDDSLETAPRSSTTE